MKPEYKKYVIIGVLVLITLIGFFLLRLKGSSQSPGEDITNNEDVIPTVDSSVIVTLTAKDSQQKDVVLSASSVPVGTETVEYELSYLTSSQGLQGVIGTIDMEGKRQFEKTLTLGTCSSGTCVYHQVVGKIKLTLKFNGDYGSKLYDKEHEL